MAAQAKFDYSKPDQTAPYYVESITKVPENMRELLENYSHVPPGDVVKYVLEARDYIFAISPWPCVGSFAFLDFTTCEHPSYPRILATLQGSATFLDVGCCVAQDLRKLAYDGARSENLFGLEITDGLFDRAFDFFQDRETFRGTLICADLMDRANPKLRHLEGTFDFVQLSMVLNTFWTLENQTTACVRIIEFLRPQSGSLIIGETVGHVTGEEGPPPRRQFKHTAETFANMWEEAGRRTGTRWKVATTLDLGRGFDARTKWETSGTRRLGFEVERL